MGEETGQQELSDVLNLADLIESQSFEPHKFIQECLHVLNVIVVAQSICYFQVKFGLAHYFPNVGVSEAILENIGELVLATQLLAFADLIHHFCLD